MGEGVRPTPIWLELAVKVRRDGALRKYEVAEPPEVLEGHNGRPLFPLSLPLGVEEDPVIEHLYSEIMRALGCVAKCERDVKFLGPGGGLGGPAVTVERP